MSFEEFPKIKSEEKKESLEQEPEELEELQTEYEGLKEMADDIKSGNFEEITEKPRE